MVKKKKEAVKTETPVRQLNPVILLFLMLSGACGLVYEILWMKLLTLVIGNTVFSMTTVLTAFMGGLALGSFLAGRFTAGIKNPMKIYALLEGGIGLYALLLPLLIAGTEPLFRLVYQGLNPSFYAFGLLRFFVCGLLLLVPTTLMGATLPVLSRYFVAGPTDLGRGIGLLYGVNTLGAVLGCALAGFVLIPTLGVTWTIYGAALLNLAICAGVLALSKNPVQLGAPSGDQGKINGKKQKKPKKQQQKQPLPEQPKKKQSGGEIEPEFPPAVVWAVMAGIGLSGLAGMIYQIAWTRVITLSIGASVYAFSLIVTAFIAGLALGSLVVARFVDGRKNLILGLSLVQGTIAISSLAIVPLLGRLPVFIAESVLDASRSFQSILWVEFAVIFALILAPTLMMGAAVPMAVKICTSDVRQVGRRFGNVYAVNTLGAILGSFVAGFLLVPWLGTQLAIMVAVSLNIVAAGAIILPARGVSLPTRLAGTLSAAAIAVLAWCVMPQWDANILISAPYLYNRVYRTVAAEKGIGLETALKDRGQLLYFKEGLQALVSVVKSMQGDLLLKINGKTDASAKGGDTATQLMIGHLPLLLHHDARDVLVIGLGSGMTLGAVERHPVKTVDVVEIEAAVVEASLYFREFTGNPLEDERVNLIVADGRNHLALSDHQYDVIVSEPSNPWVAGMANLFTREFFELASDRLRPAGLMCQWVHAYAMSSSDFKSVVRTFHAVFPYVTLWEAAFGGDYLLIGSPQKLRFSPATLAERLANERLGADLSLMRTRSPAALMSRLIMSQTAIPRFIAGTPLHTDDNALLEYSAPKALLWHQNTETLAAIYAYRQDPLDVLRSGSSDTIPPAMANELFKRFAAREKVLAGFKSYKDGAARDAMVLLEHALAVSPGDYDATHLLAELYLRIGNRFRDEKRPDEAATAYQKSIGTIDNFLRAERAVLGEEFMLDMIYSKAHIQLGILALEANRLDQAAAALEASVAGEVRYAEAHNNLGVVYERLGQYEKAEDQYRLAVDLDPKLVSAYMNLGNALLKQKKYQQAVACYHRIRELQPDFALNHYNLGVAYFEQAQWQEAEAEWERAVALKPDFDQARQLLRAVRQKTEKP